MIKIGNSTQDERTCSLKRNSKNEAESKSSISSMHSDSNHEAIYRKFIPKRSPSTVSIHKEPSNSVYDRHDTRNETLTDESNQNVSKHINTNKISARFSMGNEATKSALKKNSQKLGRIHDRSTPPPMPIEAVVQV